MKEFNSYVYYNSSHLLQEPASQHFAIDLEKMLPNNNQKCNCGNTAHYSSVSPKIFGNDPWNWEVIFKQLLYKN